MTQKTRILARGAEAIIYKIGNKVVKDRIPKGYRHPELDMKLRKRRTKAEIKLLTKANKLITAPEIMSPINNKSSNTHNTSSQKYYNNKVSGWWVNNRTKPLKRSSNFEITMDYISGKRLSDHLDKLKNYQTICKQIGKNISKLHDAGLIHGDLTTSNMILKKDKVFFIDFGLGFHSDRIEDKAVDLHLIKQALEAKHHSIYEKAFKAILSGYKASKNYSKTIKQLEKVEKRGRYKQQY